MTKLKRSLIDHYYQILWSAMYKSNKKTKMLLDTNITYTRAKKLLGDLIKVGMMEQRGMERRLRRWKGSPSELYFVTTKGLKYLESHMDFLATLNIDIDALRFGRLRNLED